MIAPGEFDDFTLLVAAAGQGLRLGQGPKAFLRLGGKTLLEWVIETGTRCMPRAVVAVPEGCVERATGELSHYPEVRVITGGATRQATYEALLATCATEFVLIRDVSRPLASAGLIARVAQAAKVHGAAGAFNAFVTPIALAKGGVVDGVVAKSEALAPSNPQAYTTAGLALAARRASQQGITSQTLWELLLLEGKTLHIVAGEEANHKITTARDWDIMQRVTFPQWLAEHYGQAEYHA